MFSNEFKLKTLGVMGSIYGWFTIVASAICFLAFVFMAFNNVGVEAVTFLFLTPIYFFAGVASLGLRVLTNKSLEE